MFRGGNRGGGGAGGGRGRGGRGSFSGGRGRGGGGGGGGKRGRESGGGGGHQKNATITGGFNIAALGDPRGFPGILIACDDQREKRAMYEVSDLLNIEIDELYPHIPASSSNNSDSSNGANVGIPLTDDHHEESSSSSSSTTTTTTTSAAAAGAKRSAPKTIEEELQEEIAELEGTGGGQHSNNKRSKRGNHNDGPSSFANDDDDEGDDDDEDGEDDNSKKLQLRPDGSANVSTKADLQSKFVNKRARWIDTGGRGIAMVWINDTQIDIIRVLDVVFSRALKEKQLPTRYTSRMIPFQRIVTTTLNGLIQGVCDVVRTSKWLVNNSSSSSSSSSSAKGASGSNSSSDAMTTLSNSEAASADAPTEASTATTSTSTTSATGPVPVTFKIEFRARNCERLKRHEVVSTLARVIADFSNGKLPQLQREGVDGDNGEDESGGENGDGKSGSGRGNTEGAHPLPHATLATAHPLPPLRPSLHSPDIIILVEAMKKFAGICIIPFDKWEAYDRYNIRTVSETEEDKAHRLSKHERDRVKFEEQLAVGAAGGGGGGSGGAATSSSGGGIVSGGIQTTNSTTQVWFPGGDSF